MNPDEPLVLTRNCFIQPLGPHRYAARASFATQTAVELNAGTMALASCFVEPCTPREARAALGDSVVADEAEFLATVAELVRHDLLRPVAPGETPAVSGSGYAHAIAQLAMLGDEPRVDAYRAAIERHAPGRRVLEIGAGTGVLSMFAARAGAASVTALEESAAIDLARRLAFENNLAEDVEFVAVNSLDYRPERRAEVIVHELIGHEPFAEHALRYLDDARARLLEPGGRMIPAGLEVWCRAIGRKGWADPQRDFAETQALRDRTGLSFLPLWKARKAAPRVATFLHDVDLAPDGAESGDGRLYRIDFGRPIAGQGADRPVETSLPIVTGGVVNSIIVWFRARMDEDLWLTNAPGEPRTHWTLAVYDLPEPRTVEAGHAITVRAHLEPIDGMERMLVRTETGSFFPNPH